MTLATAQGAINDVVIDPANVYWNTNAPPDGIGQVLAYVRSQPLGGGATSQVLFTTEGSRNLFANGNYIYWASSYGSPQRIYRTLVGSGTNTQLVTASSVSALTTDAVNVYWTDSGTNKVMKAPAAGGAAVQLAVASTPVSIYTDGASVFWSNFQDTADSGSIRVVGVNGGAVTTIVPGQVKVQPYAMTCDGPNLFWGTSTNAGYELRTAPAAGGAVSKITDVASASNKIVTDARYVYFYNGPKISRIVKNP